MTQDHAPFSQRHGYQPPNPEITVREDAPKWLRDWLAHVPMRFGLTPNDVLRIVRQQRQQPENPFLASGIHLTFCRWYEVYDFAECIYDVFSRFKNRTKPTTGEQYEDGLNKLFRDHGVGWQMRSGKIVVRGSEPFEAVTRKASETLVEHTRATAAREIDEALRDLSRRPKPDASGAIQHAMAAFECVMRELSGENNATLGDLLKWYGRALGIASPLDGALSKLWGYASQRGRHSERGATPASRMRNS